MGQRQSANGAQTLVAVVALTPTPARQTRRRTAPHRLSRASADSDGDVISSADEFLGLATPALGSAVDDHRRGAATVVSGRRHARRPNMEGAAETDPRPDPAGHRPLAQQQPGGSDRLVPARARNVSAHAKICGARPTRTLGAQRLRAQTKLVGLGRVGGWRVCRLEHVHNRVTGTMGLHPLAHRLLAQFRLHGRGHADSVHAPARRTTATRTPASIPNAGRTPSRAS